MKPLIAFLILLLCSSHAATQEPRNVTILVPLFESRTKFEAEPGTIGRRTSLILGLQVWRTFRIPPPWRWGTTIKGGKISWDKDSIPKSFEEAEQTARANSEDVHLVLWGKAAQYGNGIVVDSNLSILNDETGGRLGTNIWTVAILSRGGMRYSLSVSIPEWRYEFGPIVLEPGVLPEISDASYIKLYAQPNMRAVIGDLRDYTFIALRHTGEYAQVKSEGKVGWVYLPNISKSSEVVNFCGGVIRVFRRDWQGAIILFNKVINNEHTPTAVRIASFLYMAIAAENLRDRARSLSFIEQAYRLNPYLKVTTQYLLMSHLANLAQLYPHQMRTLQARRSIDIAREILSKNSVLFAEQDPWILQVEKLLSEVTSR